MQDRYMNEDPMQDLIQCFTAVTDRNFTSAEYTGRDGGTLNVADGLFAVARELRLLRESEDALVGIANALHRLAEAQDQKEAHSG